MKREEEIQQAMKESVCETIYSSGYGFTPQATDLLECAFTKGANWADRTMLDRACEWLGNELKETDNKNGYPTVEGLYFVSVKEFINEFRQAMEGGAE